MLSEMLTAIKESGRQWFIFWFQSANWSRNDEHICLGKKYLCRSIFKIQFQFP